MKSLEKVRLLEGSHRRSGRGDRRHTSPRMLVERCA